MSAWSSGTLTKLVDIAPDAMLVADATGVIVLANVASQQLFDYGAKEMVGMRLSILGPFVKESEQVSPHAFDSQVIATRRAGDTFAAEYSSVALTTESSHFTFIVLRDVSARGEMEAERLRSDSRADDVRIAAEVQRVIAEAEKTEAERVRLEVEVQRVIAEAEKTEAERVRLEAEVQRVIAEAEKTEAERVRLEAEIVLDRLERQLHQSQRMESLGQLAGGVAHDFNNLLAVIINYASFVAEELTTAVGESTDKKWEGTLNDVSQIQIAAERASVLTHQLLAFARREVIQSRPLSFNEAIRNIEEILHRTIGEQIELAFVLEPDLSLVFADPGHIEQIILNLAINARDAMPHGGTLCIETSSHQITESEASLFDAPPGSYVCVRISDSGTGMSPETRDRAFEPFYTTKPRGEGSGLGLATVYGIVLQSGGFTRIYSDEGVGTTITILLPVASAQPEVTDELRDAAPASSSERNETILVVDDEEGLREVARRILTRNGYRVLTATSGAEALEIVATHTTPIDLLVTDVVMPKMQGPEVAREVQMLMPNVKVLYMSGHAQPVLESEAVLGTDFQFLRKPFDQKTLIDNVRRVLDSHEIATS